MRTRFKILTCLGIALALFQANSSLKAQQDTVGLRLDVDQREVTVGDTLTVTVEFKQLGTGTSTASGEPSIPTPQDFEIRGQSSNTQVSIINQQTAMISTTKYKLAATKAGEETLGPALLIYQDDQQKRREIKSNVATVKVVEKGGFSLFGGKKDEDTPTPDNANPSANSNDLRDLKPLLPESTNWLRIIIWSLVILLIVGFVLWRFLKPNKAGPPTLPMGKEAQLRDTWKKLANENLSSKEFCLGLSSLVRECLQYRYQLPAVYSTTEEILKQMASRKVSDDEKAAIEKCLKTCDRVLHADGSLTGRDNLRALCSILLPKVSRN
jgi:hypothetical protein